MKSLILLSLVTHIFAYSVDYFTVLNQNQNLVQAGVGSLGLHYITFLNDFNPVTFNESNRVWMRSVSNKWSYIDVGLKNFSDVTHLLTDLNNQTVKGDSEITRGDVHFYLYKNKFVGLKINKKIVANVNLRSLHFLGFDKNYTSDEHTIAYEKIFDRPNVVIVKNIDKFNISTFMELVPVDYDKSYTSKYFRKFSNNYSQRVKLEFYSELHKKITIPKWFAVVHTDYFS